MKTNLKVFSFIILVLLFICLGLSCNNNINNTSLSQYHTVMGISKKDRIQTIIRLWEQQATGHKLNKEIISNVSDLIDQAMNTRESAQFLDSDVYVPMETKPIEESLDRFLKQFGPYLINPDKRSGTSYWIAWLLVQCAKRNQPTVDEIEETKLWFEEFKKNVWVAVDGNIKTALGREDYLKYVEQIEQTRIWIGKTLDIYFDEFHDDPLFPLFKKPLSDSNEKEVLHRILVDTTFSNSIKSRRKLMVLEEEHIVKQMEIVFGLTPKEVIFRALISSNIDEWEKEEYWGGMIADATTGVGIEGIWPIEVNLRRIITNENKILGEN